MLEKAPSKAWRRKGECIVDTAQAQAQARSKLNGLDKLVLELK